MYVVKPYETAVTLFHVDGRVWVYKTLRSAFQALGLHWISMNVGRNFVEYRGDSYTHFSNGFVDKHREYRAHAFIMRDDFGVVLTSVDFQHFVKRKLPWYLRRYEHWNGQGPVPGTRKPKAGYDHYHQRCPAHVRQAAVTFMEEGEVAPRAKRRNNALKDIKYDYYPDDRYVRNWKHYRKKQWRE